MGGDQGIWDITKEYRDDEECESVDQGTYSITTHAGHGTGNDQGRSWGYA